MTITIYEGDAIEIMKKLPSGSIDLVFTDPPYNISKKGVFYRDYRSGKARDIQRDFGEWDYEFVPDDFLIEAKRLLNDDGQIVIWTSEQLYGEYRKWFMENGMFPKQMIIWEKLNPVPQFRKMGYLQATELMIWATKNRLSKKNPNFIFQNDQNEMKNIFHAGIVSYPERYEHPTQKPLSICEKIMERHCGEGGLVLDPYTGTGTILAAAKRLRRNAIGIEINSEYVKIARKRIDETFEMSELNVSSLEVDE